MKMNSLQALFEDQIKDLYSAENQLVKALPKIAKAASSPELKTIVTEHLAETKGQVERLKQVFTHLGKKPTGQHCSAMEGLVEEGKEAMVLGIRPLFPERVDLRADD